MCNRAECCPRGGGGGEGGGWTGGRAGELFWRLCINSSFYERMKVVTDYANECKEIGWTGGVEKEEAKEEAKEGFFLSGIFSVWRLEANLPDAFIFPDALPHKF